MNQQNAGKTAILFDLDGTLVDTVYEHVSAWATALKSGGLYIPKWKIHRRIGMSGSSMVRQLVREEGRRALLDIALLERKHDKAFTKAIRGIPVLPGAQELLKFLTKNHVPWAVATTGSKQQTCRLLGKLSIPTGVPIVTGDDVAKAKPSPDVFVLAADRLGLPVSNCIVTGDSVWDVLAAARKRALGIGLLSGGYGREELNEAGAFRIYADPMDMLRHIEDLGIDALRP
jgi:HAD superfamily hydrolase (TIGR01549 family)